MHLSDPTATRHPPCDEFERFFTLAFDMCCVTSIEGTFLRVNPAWERGLGYSEAELLGHSFLELLHAEDVARSTAELARIAAGQAECLFVNRYRHRDGTYRWLEWTPSEPTPDGRIYAVARDVTERFERDRRKEQFVATVAHELRTPLSALFGSLRLMASGKLEGDPASRQRILDIAVNNAERLTRLIDDLLEFERLKSGHTVMELEACNAEDLLLQLEDTMGPVAERAGVDLEVGISSVPMRADPDRVIQVLLNLVGNALKFTPAGGGVRVSARAESGGVRFEVADSGRGIPAPMRERIFERFRQVSRSDAIDKGGSGLGLAICRGLVEAHGGRIGVESQEGQGSTFWFTLPSPGAPQEARATLDPAPPGGILTPAQGRAAPRGGREDPMERDWIPPEPHGVERVGSDEDLVERDVPPPDFEGEFGERDTDRPRDQEDAGPH